MDGGTFDLVGLAKWGVAKALGQVEEKIGFPIQEHLLPLVPMAMEQMGIAGEVALNLPLLIAGKIMMSSFQKQMELDKIRRNQNANGDGRS